MRYLVEVFWSDEDDGYNAVVPDLPGCSAFGRTPEPGRPSSTALRIDEASFGVRCRPGCGAALLRGPDCRREGRRKPLPELAGAAESCYAGR